MGSVRPEKIRFKSAGGAGPPSVRFSKWSMYTHTHTHGEGRGGKRERAENKFISECGRARGAVDG